MTRGKTLLSATLALAMAGAAAPGADVLVTTKNRRFEGQVVEMTASKVVIRTTLHGFETTLTFARSEIASLELDDTDPAPDAAPVGGEEADEADAFTADQLRKVEKEAEPVREAPVKRDGVPMYMEIPLRGTFGEEIYPKGVAESLKFAVENGVTDVIFRIDSGGGEVWAAQRIVELMEEHTQTLRYHALIERSISASIWPTFNCDTITMAPASAFGGAVVFRVSDNSGSFEVDKKFNSIRMAELVAQAEENGHAGQVVRAMMLSEEKLYAAKPKGSDEWVFLSEMPADPSRYASFETIDTEQQILTLTANQADRYGIAAKLDTSDADALRARLGYAEWDHAGVVGDELTEEWAAKCQDMRQRLFAQGATISASIARVNSEKYLRGAIRALEQLKRDIIDYGRIVDDAQGLELGGLAEELDKGWEKYTRTEIDRMIKEYRTKLLYGP